MKYIYKRTELTPQLIEEKYSFYNLPRGGGNTLGNAIRRTVMNSTPGLAITAFKINNISYEFTYIDGVQEDLMQIAFNMRKVQFIYNPNFTEKDFRLQFEGPYIVSSNDLNCEAEGVKVLNSIPLFHIVDKINVTIEFNIRNDINFVAHTDNQLYHPDMIGVTSLHSGVEKVNFVVENSANLFNDAVSITIERLDIYPDHFVLLNALNQMNKMNKYILSMINNPNTNFTDLKHIDINPEIFNDIDQNFMPKKVSYSLHEENIKTNQELMDKLSSDRIKSMNSAIVNYLLLYAKYMSYNNVTETLKQNET